MAANTPRIDSIDSSITTLDAKTQPATPTTAGLVGTGAQTFAGDKTFSGAIDAAGGFTGAGGLATSTTAGIAKKSKIKIKELGASTTTPAIIATFNNLDPAKSYYVSFSAGYYNTAGGGGGSFKLRTGGSVIATLAFFNSGASGVPITASGHYVFTGQSTVNVYFAPDGPNFYLAATECPARVFLEELNDSVDAGFDWN